jgi:hypothetical protein
MAGAENTSATRFSPGRRAAVAIAAGLFTAGLAACTPQGTVRNDACIEMADRTGEKQLPVPFVECKLGRLAVKGRAPMTGYDRDEFGSGWTETAGCDTRNRILKRDLQNETFDEDGCKVLTGDLHDPYTGKVIHFIRGRKTSALVQIDHIVPLGDAWQTGAQQLSESARSAFANDPDNLSAVQGRANEQKGDGDAATWLPPNKTYRCTYVARQVMVKSEYHLWVTPAEHDAIETVLSTCRDDTVTLP